MGTQKFASRFLILNWFKVFRASANYLKSIKKEDLVNSIVPQLMSSARLLPGAILKHIEPWRERVTAIQITCLRYFDKPIDPEINGSRFKIAESGKFDRETVWSNRYSLEEVLKLADKTVSTLESYMSESRDAKYKGIAIEMELYKDETLLHRIPYIFSLNQPGAP